MPSLCSEFPNDNPSLHGGVIWVCLDTVGPPSAERVLPPAAPSSAEEAAPTEREEEVARAEDAHAVDAHVEAIPDARPSGIVPIAASASIDDLADEEEESSASAIVVEELEPLEVVSVEGLEDAPSVEAPAEPEAEDVHANDFAPRDSTALPPPPDDPFTVLVCTLADVAIAAGAPNVAAALPELLVDGRLDPALPEEAMAALAAGGLVDGDGAATAALVETTRAWRAILRGTSDDFSACGSGMLDEWASDLLARLLGAPGRAPTLRSELRSRGVAAFGLIEAA